MIRRLSPGKERFGVEGCARSLSTGRVEAVEGDRRGGRPGKVCGLAESWGSL